MANDEHRGDDDHRDADAAPLVHVSPAVGHPSSEVVDAGADDTAPVLDDASATAGRDDATLPGADVAAVTGGYPADLRTAEQPPTLPD